LSLALNDYLTDYPPTATVFIEDAEVLLTQIREIADLLWVAPLGIEHIIATINILDKHPIFQPAHSLQQTTASLEFSTLTVKTICARMCAIASEFSDPIEHDPDLAAICSAILKELIHYDCDKTKQVQNNAIKVREKFINEFSQVNDKSVEDY
jgi:hypothetical protein